MKKIIKFEFLKIFTNKLFIFTLLALILANIIIIHITNKLNENEIPNSAYKLLNMEIKDLSEEEKGDLIESEYEKNYAYNIINNIKNLENSENDYMREYSESVKQENKNLYEKYIADFENATYKYTGDIGKELSFWEEIKNEYEESKNYKQIVKDILDKAENLETISIFKDSQDDFSSKNIKDTAKEYEKIDTYIHTLLQSSDLTESARVCDHHMLNVILSRYQRQCQEKYITFHTDIRSGVLRHLPDADLTAIFCNILDNALESASKTDHALIELNVHRKEHTPFAVITMINSCRTDPFTAHNHQLITSKKKPSSHGFGLKSVRRIVERYEGSMNLYYDEKDLLFHTIILLRQPYPSTPFS